MSDQPFLLHPQLEADTHIVGYFPLSLVLLCNDANYPWCILVPRRADIREIHHLNSEDKQSLLAESCCLAESMEQLFTPTKMNVAALGNMVPQLHIHHIARFEDDPAWPAPVWGKEAAKEYDSEVFEARLQSLREHLANSDIAFKLAL